ncbi:MAG: CPBP family intramembrane metalloprotease [Candidatus Marinimicrobia bacterium]|nr:CPBP family intramembrane metalloprotease [Candidatus Neomarinimicrobiota bacterium]
MDKKWHGLQAGIGFFVYLAVVFCVGAVVSVWAWRWWGADTGGVLATVSPGRLTRRVLMIAAVLAAPILARATRWNGWRDLGLQPAQGTFSRRRAAGYFGRGLAVGVVTVGLLGGMMLLAGSRTIDPTVRVGVLLGRVFSYALAGIVISVIEEPFTRGFLFRPLGRAWGGGRVGWLAAALVASFVFGAVHFVDPGLAAFNRPSYWNAVGAVLHECFVPDPLPAHYAIRLVNLTLLGLVLCAWVLRTGTLWYGIGLHSGVVWVMKVAGYATDQAAEVAQSSVWLSGRADLTDSWSATLVLLAMLVPWFGGRKRISPAGDETRRPAPAIPTGRRTP